MFATYLLLVCQVFRFFPKSIATLPSSAAVERLFSAAAQILTARRSRMMVHTLVRLLFLKSVYRMSQWLSNWHCNYDIGMLWLWTCDCDWI